MKKRISRRKILGDSAKVGATLLLSSCASGLRTISSLSVDEDKFEFIIVGSGAGGGPLAARLARLGHKVLLIEAGNSGIDSTYTVPAFQGLSTEHEKWSWKFFPQHYADAAQNAKDSKFEPKEGGVFYPRASGLGGCTTHHALVTMVPDESDWQNIASLARAETGKGGGWTPREMRKYLTLLEDNRYLGDRVAKRWQYGTEGWLSTETTSRSLAIRDQALRSIVLGAAGYDGYINDIGAVTRFINASVALDTNRPFPIRPEGLAVVPKATREGKRRGPREWLLETQKEFPQNLKILTNAFVTQLLFDSNDSSKVVGVEYERGEYLYEASPLYPKRRMQGKGRALAKEVVLAGGAFNTPQLLMLSGIGDFSKLPNGVTKRVHLPGVGENLQDRYEVGVISKLHSPIEAIKDCKFEVDTSDPCYRDYLQDSQSSVYSSNGIIVGQVQRSQFANSKDPDLFVFAAPGAFKGYHTGWSREALKNDHFTWAILKAHTSNTKGYVRLKSANPFERPEINFNFFADGGNDLDAVIEGVKLARKMNSTGPLKKLIQQEVLPGAGVQGEDLKDFVMNETWGHHASCTCKMGSEKDAMAVVDTEFRVHKTKGLRIVDASVFPKIPGMFIVVPIYMLAEKAADTIHQEHSRG